MLPYYSTLGLYMRNLIKFLWMELFILFCWVLYIEIPRNFSFTKALFFFSDSITSEACWVCCARPWCFIIHKSTFDAHQLINQEAFQEILWGMKIGYQLIFIEIFQSILNVFNVILYYRGVASIMLNCNVDYIRKRHYAHINCIWYISRRASRLLTVCTHLHWGN